MVFADRLKTLTFDLRSREKAHYAKVQELHGEDTTFADDLEMDGGKNDDMLQAVETVADQNKSVEIQNLVKTINELAVLFKDLSTLVVE